MPARFQRYRKIADVMVRYGFGILIDEIVPSYFRPGRRKRIENHESVYLRIRLALQELGPTYVKFGQLMSNRRDLLPRPLIDELKHLQDDVAPVPFEQILPYLTELCPDLSSCLSCVDPQPIAAASLSQVHTAILDDGTQVVLKVQRPGISETIKTDIAILNRLATRIEQLFPDLRVFNPRGMVHDFDEHIRRELDFSRDGRNADRLRHNMRTVPGLRIPKIFWRYSNPRVLVMERIEGVRVDDRNAIERMGISGRDIAEIGLRAYSQQIFFDGFFHGDPHPGNLLVTPKGELALLDFGIVGVLRPDRRRAFLRLMTGFMDEDVDGILRAFRGIGVPVPEERQETLKDELYLLVAEYRDLSVRQYDLSHLIADGTDLLREHGLTLPQTVLRLLVVMMMVIDIGQSLDPGFRFTERAAPYMQEVMRRDRFSAERLGDTARGIESAAHELIELPVSLGEAARRFARGPIELDLVNDDFHRIDAMLDRTGDKILVGLVTAAIVVGSSLVLDNTRFELPGSVTFIAVVSYVGAVVIGFFAIYHILRGRL
jgi:ubiquinone biosynthesis protein